jgi:arginyl-tRNA synthetase
MGEDKNYTADDLLSETEQKALEIVSSSKRISKNANLSEIARAVALSAIKFEYLRIAPEKSFVFSWSSALNFESNSGPYVMYTYARSNKILKNAEYTATLPAAGDIAHITRGQDFDIVKKIGMLQEVIAKACQENRPNILTDYLLDISSMFSTFYESMPVIKGGEAKNIRLAIVQVIAIVLENTLKLLGISPVQEM